MANVPLALTALLMELGVIDCDSRRKLEKLIVHLVHCAAYYGACCERGVAWTRLSRFNPEDWELKIEVAGKGGDLARKLDGLDWDKILPIPEEGEEES